MIRNPRKTNLKQAGQKISAVVMIAAVLLTGCQGQSALDAAFQQQGKVQNILKNTPTPQIETAIGQASPLKTPAFSNLTIWIPQQFDPEAKSDSAELLNNRFKEFSKNNPNINLDVRIKSGSGPGSILETLMSASVVAPDALPSIILLSRSEMVQAASKNLLIPIEGLSEPVNKDDWFDVSSELGSYQGTLYCLPFAIDALGLVSKNSRLKSDQPPWAEMINQSEQLFIATGDSEALTTLALYMSAGGSITDKNGQPILEKDALVKVLSAYAEAVALSKFSESNLGFQTDDEVWENFLSAKKGTALTWSHHALSDRKNLRLALLPSLGNYPFTLAGGWMWCVTEPHEQDRIISASLIEFLLDPGFLGTWAPVSEFLPVRLSSISNYEDKELQSTIKKMLLAAQVRPDKLEISEIGTEFKIAISEVLQRSNTPEIIAVNAIKRLEALKTQ
jgi:multiple sugar transport system substrate-binding protein